MQISATLPVTDIQAQAFTIPTDAPESDGTIAWDSTTLVTATIAAGGKSGFGYTYCDKTAASLCRDVLGEILRGRDALDTALAWDCMNRAVRNIGRPGIASCAISVMDVALWDLKAKLLNLPLVALLGRAREKVPVYGSGGFTSYSFEQLERQLGGWAAQGCPWVKMKVGREPNADQARVKAARAAIAHTTLFVDANGAYNRAEALSFAKIFADLDVAWLEEPVSSDDLDGLRLLRDRAPPGMAIAAGEYGYTPYYFRTMLAAGAVDVLQADATRCGGITGFLRAAALADAFHIPLSSHCAPALHLTPACAAPGFMHMEWFHDHVRIEQMLMEGAPRLKDGHVAPDMTVSGHGLSLRQKDAERFAA